MGVFYITLEKNVSIQASLRKRIGVAVVLLAGILLAQPAHAGVLAVWECATSDIWCGGNAGSVPANNADYTNDAKFPLWVNDSSTMFLSTLLSSNLADVTYSATFEAVNNAGLVLSLTGNNVSVTWHGAGPGYVDLYLADDYLGSTLLMHAPNLFSAEFLTGTCNAAAITGKDGVVGQMYAQSSALPAIGSATACLDTAGNFDYSAGPWIVPGLTFHLAAVAQFSFAGNTVAGGLETIELPFGNSETVPEPASCALFGAGLIGLASRRRRK